jgi:thymidylate synthase
MSNNVINIILAVDKNGGLGLKNKLPWYISDELKIFKEKTLNSIVIVGRKTLETLPCLKDRQIFCVTRNTNNVKSNNDIITCFYHIEEAIEQSLKLDKKVFIIGGHQIYNYVFQKLKSIYNFKVHISFLKDSYECDTYFDIQNLKNFYISKKDDYELFTHYEMEYQKYGEQQYLDLLKDVIKNGERRKTRNGETISEFCKHLKFDLRDGFPLLTTKKMFLKGIIEELLFFIRGDTNSKILEEKGINIWKGNTSREFLDENDFTDYEPGIMGPMYGYQWRFFNAPYNLKKFIPVKYGMCSLNIKHPDQYVDQLKDLIDEIKTNPTSRRLLLTTYNPGQAKHGVLYPCHSITIQFYVQDGFLDMFCYNRSSDIALGIPFNIASSSMLLLMIAKLTDLIPRYFNLTLGDSHIYADHIEPIKTQIERLPYTCPKIVLPEFKSLEEVEKLTFEDFKLIEYNSYPTIKMSMVA